MDVIYTLIPAMVLLGLLMLGVLIWAIRKGQYEDPEGDAHRILLDEDEPDGPRKEGVNRPPHWPDAD